MGGCASPGIGVAGEAHGGVGGLAGGAGGGGDAGGGDVQR